MSDKTKNNYMCGRKRLLWQPQGGHSPARGISEIVSGSRGDTCESGASYNVFRRTQITTHSDGPVSRLEIGNNSDEASEPANPGFTACVLLLSHAIPLVIKARSCDSLRSHDNTTGLASGYQNASLLSIGTKGGKQHKMVQRLMRFGSFG